MGLRLAALATGAPLENWSRCSQWPNHKNICHAIKVLTEGENPKSTETAFLSHLTPTQHAKIVNLVGRKCTVNCLLNDSEVSALWDTGAQVSIMNQAMLEETLPGTTVKDISELINVGFDLTAANRSKIHWLGRRESTTSITDKWRTRSSCSISCNCWSFRNANTGL